MKYFKSFTALSLQNLLCILHLRNMSIQMLNFYLRTLNLYLDSVTFTGEEVGSHIDPDIRKGLPVTVSSVNIQNLN